MTTYSRRTAGRTEASKTSREIVAGTGVIEILAPARAHGRAAAAHNERPQRPALRWRITEQGLRMSWSDAASAR